MNHVLIRGWIHFTGSNLESGHLQYLRAELLLATAASISAFKLPARSSSSFVRSYSTEASKHGCVKDKEGQSERGRERARARERERESEGGREGGREGERETESESGTTYYLYRRLRLLFRRRQGRRQRSLRQRRQGRPPRQRGRG